MNPASPALRRVHALTWAALVVTIALTVGIGGTITSAEVGMAYPTWPDINGGSLFSLFYGELAERFGWGSLIEHTHRQAGALTGLLVLAAAIASWCGRGVPRAVRLLAAAVLLATIAQGLLGAGRVLANSYAGAVVHALGAQAVVVLIVALLKRSAPAWSEAPATGSALAVARLRTWTGGAVALLFLNLLAAASLRHKQGAFAAHLVLALSSAAALVLSAWFTREGFAGAGRLRRLAKRLHAALGMQILLGAAAWLYLLGPLAAGAENTRGLFVWQAVLATAHLLCGVLVMAAAAALWIEARWCTRAEPQS